MAPSRSACALLLACALALAMRVPVCQAHGYLQVPQSRSLVMRPGDTYLASSGNGRMNNMVPDVCGDPHQDAGSIGLKDFVGANQATYTSGSIIDVTFRAQVNHGGWIAVKICPTAQRSPTQACFDQYQLTNVDSKTKRYWLQSGQWGTMTSYPTRWQLPAGVSCANGCVMQLLYKTANSCIDACTEAECGRDYAQRMNYRMPAGLQGPKSLCTAGAANGQAGWGEYFHDCADIRITGGSTGGGGGSGGNPPTGNCGNGVVGNGKCAVAGQCCSKFGWCGTTAEHCGTTTVPGTCGNGNVGNGRCAVSGQCCSKWGWCGTTAEHCGGGRRALRQEGRAAVNVTATA